jgi:type IV pilus assembly protein PilA
MLQRLRHRAQGQEGFTLIELLVVILIIGILAGVAIPVFLSQIGKANDANVKSDINAAATAEETYYTDNQAYVAASSSNNTAIVAVNPALGNAFNAVTPTASGGVTPQAGDAMAITLNGSGSTGGYQITGSSKSTVTYTYNKPASGGAVTRTCTPAGTGGCPASGNW